MRAPSPPPPPCRSLQSAPNLQFPWAKNAHGLLLFSTHPPGDLVVFCIIGVLTLGTFGAVSLLEVVANTFSFAFPCALRAAAGSTLGGPARLGSTGASSLPFFAFTFALAFAFAFSFIYGRRGCTVLGYVG